MLGDNHQLQPSDLRLKRNDRSMQPNKNGSLDHTRRMWADKSSLPRRDQGLLGDDHRSSGSIAVGTCVIEPPGPLFVAHTV